MIRNFLLVSLLCSFACGDDDGLSDAGGVDALAQDTGGTDTSVADATGTDATNTDATDIDAGPTSCGGRGGGTCADTEFCDFQNNICGAADGSGTCQPRPEGCTREVVPVCGCDGTTHNNECEANSAGWDVSSLAGCTPPADTFPCGYRFCSTSSYCQIVVDDTGMPPEYHCGPLPASCNRAQSCACVAAETCGDMCTADDDGNLTLTCPGG